MKVTVTELPRKLQKGPPHLVSIVGNEDFLQREAVSQILNAVHGGPAPAEDTTRLTGRSKPSAEDLTRLFDELRTPSLFGGERSVVVDQADAFLAVDRAAWGPFLESSWTGATLVLLMTNLDGRTKLAKVLKEKGWLVEVAKPFNRPPPWKTDSPPWENDLNRWIVGRARHLKLRIDPPTAHMLQTRVGTGLGDLASALERLGTFLEGKSDEVSRQVVEEHTRDGEESHVFELVDAFFVADRKRLMNMTRGLIERGSVDSRGARVTDPAGLLLQFIGAALRRVRQLREVQRVVAAGGDEAEILRAAGVARPFLPRLRQQAKATPPARLQRIVHHLRRADGDLKSGRGPLAAELLERLAVSATL